MIRLVPPSVRDCTFRRDPVCPHCGHVEEFWDDTLLINARDGETKPHVCKWCRRPFLVEVTILRKFTTRKDER